MTQVAGTNLKVDWIDEIQTDPSTRKAMIVAVAAVLLGLMGIGFWYYTPEALTAYLQSNAQATIHLHKSGYPRYLQYTFWAFGIVGGLCGVAGLSSLVRIKPTYHVLRAVLVLVYPTVLGYAALAWLAILSLARHKIEIDGSVPDRAAAITLWWQMAWPALAMSAYTFWLHVMLTSRSVRAAFTGQVGAPTRGDHILEDWRTHGRNPRARKSFYASWVTHLILLVLIPFLMNIDGCARDYRVPKGSGNPVVALVKIVKPKKKKKQKLTLRPNSAIIFDIPDLDDTEVDQVMEELTQATYEASVNAKAGKIGRGGGKTGGWPEGSENYEIRFIRLEHGGRGWDDGMNQTNADMNFLRAFAQITGFKKIAAKGESHPISRLAKYSNDGFPPFVYLTGNERLGRISNRDRKILREYCLKGGMLIADAGSRDFDRSFRDFMRQVFWDKPLLDIADDDMIYQLPFGFPNGAPAFWAHGGRRALGIKHEGRWVVFYHPGDMNDAWKSPGYSDVTPEMRNAAIHLGVNLVYYAYTQRDEAVARMRK